MKKSFLSLLMILIALPGTSFALDTYTIDTSHSVVEFGVTHMVIAKVKGKFTDFEGTIKYGDNFKDWQIEGEIKVASINTANEKRDDHLRNADFFAVDKYPTITFNSKSMVKKGDGYVCVGDFTMRGVTKEVQVPFKITGVIKDPWGGTRLGLEATLKLDRQDYGVSYNTPLDSGGVAIGNEIDIAIFVEAVKAEMKEK